MTIIHLPKVFVTEEDGMRILAEIRASLDSGDYVAVEGSHSIMAGVAPNYLASLVQYYEDDWLATRVSFNIGTNAEHMRRRVENARQFRKHQWVGKGFDEYSANKNPIQVFKQNHPDIRIVEETSVSLITPNQEFASYSTGWRLRKRAEALFE